jgi:hypothetical protein
MFRILASVLLGLILSPSVVLGQYLDPGATSFVVQLVIAGVVGFATVLKLYWKKLAGLFHRNPLRQGEELE